MVTAWALAASAMPKDASTTAPRKKSRRFMANLLQYYSARIPT